MPEIRSGAARAVACWAVDDEAMAHVEPTFAYMRAPRKRRSGSQTQPRSGQSTRSSRNTTATEIRFSTTPKRIICVCETRPVL